MSCFFHTAFSDPGIIPRARPDEAAYTERFILDQYDNGTGQRTRPPPRTKEIFINNVDLSPTKISFLFPYHEFSICSSLDLAKAYPCVRVSTLRKREQ